MAYLIGNLKILLFHSDSNGFTTCKCTIKGHSEDIDFDTIESAKQSGLVTLTGYFNVPKKEVDYKFHGSFIRHAKYGIQFSVERTEVNKNDSVDGIIAYLASGHFEGVGPVTARKIVDLLGLDAVDIIKKDPEVLNDILPTRRAMVIRRTILENSDSEESLADLCKVGFSPQVAMRLIKQYGKEALNTFNDNAYQIINDIPGIGFELIDELAIKNGYRKTNSSRVQAMLKYVLKLACNSSGYTYLSHSQLLQDTYRFSKKDDDLKEYLVENLRKLIIQGEIIEENEKLYDKILYHCEVNIANRLVDLISNQNVELNSDVVEEVESKLGIQYAQKQREAIRAAVSEKCMVLTGGPGTGKTTVVKGIIEALKLNGYLLRDFALLAPTGRAAKRINEQTGMLSMTIHRYLGYDGENKFERNEFNQVDERVIIVDESSMIDVYLFSQLLKAIKPYAKLILVGDDDQLPSVGPGQILKDIIDSEMLEVCKLTDIHRQSLDSNIVRLAHAVRIGEDPTQILAEKKDVSFIPCSTNQFSAVLDHVMTSASNKGIKFDDIQILAPLYKREYVGIDSINRLMQSQFNPKKPHEIEVQFGQEKVYRVNDKVIQSKNRPLENVMNGDVGYIERIVDAKDTEEKEMQILVRYDNELIRYQRNELIELNHAYAITVHKSQGSEYPVVILPIFNSYSLMLKRKILYTAITRAKNSLVIIGEKSALDLAINSIDPDRQSTLIERMQNANPIKKKKKRVHPIVDDEIPFDELGEDNMEDISPYSFM